MSEVGCLVDLLLFYTVERLLFNRMVCTMGLISDHVKKAISFWLLLEEIGYRDLIRTINSRDNATVKTLFYNSLQCLIFIQPSYIPPTEPDDEPVFPGLFLQDSAVITRRFLYDNREYLLRRYTHVMETVCERIFGENKAVEVDETGFRPVIVVHPEEGSPSSSLGMYDGKPRLNPSAVEFNPEEIPVESRTMFLTFSRGYPLSREEIVSFFTSNWGGVVQDVFLERTQDGQDPRFARVVLTSSMVIPKILNGQTKAKFSVNRKHLWMRMYVPHRRGSSKATMSQEVGEWPVEGSD